MGKSYKNGYVMFILAGLLFFVTGICITIFSNPKGLLFCLFGLLALVAGIYGLVKLIKQENKNKELKSTGQLIKCVISQIKYDHSLMVNDLPANCICICEPCDPKYNYVFQSPPFNSLSFASVGDLVDVYVNIDDPSKYFVDISTLKKQSRTALKNKQGYVCKYCGTRYESYISNCQNCGSKIEKI